MDFRKEMRDGTIPKSDIIDESTFNIRTIVELRKQVGQFKDHYTLRKRIVRWLKNTWYTIWT